MNKRFCPVCQKLNLKSRVFDKGTIISGLGITKYWDEEGEYYIYDNNKYITEFRCSKNHLWTETKQNGRGLIIEIFNLETNQGK